MTSATPFVWLQVLDAAFFLLHSALIVFNMIGWAFQTTRKLHIYALAATLFSWFVMGAVRGWGYCLCTDWHFQVRRAMGLQDNVHSFFQLVSAVFFHIHMDLQTSNLLACGGLLLIICATLTVWLREWTRKRRNS